MTEKIETIEELVSYKGPHQITHFTDYLLERANEPAGQIFECGFESFDKHMKGLKTGEVVVVTGKKKNGKTLFAESWLRSMMKKDPMAKCVILSFEMTPEDLLAKYTQEPELPIYLPFKLKTMDFDWLLERCLEAKLKFNCRIVMIDHLHFMVDMMTKQNMSLNIGAFMRKLKQEIAIGLKMSVILIAHQSNLRDGQEASSDSMRDSSFIGQECDSVIVVSRRKNYTDAELDKISGNDFQKYLRIKERNEFKQPLADGEDDPYSAGFATVKIAKRLTGTDQDDRSKAQTLFQRGIYELLSNDDRKRPRSL